MLPLSHYDCFHHHCPTTDCFIVSAPAKELDVWVPEAASDFKSLRVYWKVHLESFLAAKLRVFVQHRLATRVLTLLAVVSCSLSHFGLCGRAVSSL